ncbi:MAG: hypothetical protein HC852_04430 [Acaryochloridaceae cyanobacterium RU_4_10]|nr:hypothetical protein [Acaryochloridaceae cyanobacterium RU_4_10]
MDGAGGVEGEGVSTVGGSDEFDGVAEVGLAVVLQVEEGICVAESSSKVDDAGACVGVEEGGFKGVAGGEVALVQVGEEEGELEGFGSLGDDEGLAEVALVGGVFAEDGVAVEDLAIASGAPVGSGVEAAVVDADECTGGEGGGGA